MVSMNTAVFMVVAIAATVASGVIPAVYAAQPADPNRFGKATSQFLADDRQMGIHSSDPSGDGRSDPDPRVGIGNVLNQGNPNDPIGGASKHPSDLVPVLCPPLTTDPRCTSQVDPGN
jgi:hypothetical protein